MRVKITELKITLCLILLLIIMVSIVLCSHSESSKVEYSEPTTTIGTLKTQETEPDEQIDKIETNKINSEEEVIEEESTEIVTEETTIVTEEIIVQEESYLQNETLIGSDEFGFEDALMLHKISVAEAGGESIESMAIIIRVILNRVMSENFPNSIEEVIFQKTNGVAQFSPIIDGNYDKAEPNEKS